jgi:hypothetical protein
MFYNKIPFLFFCRLLTAAFILAAAAGCYESSYREGTLDAAGDAREDTPGRDTADIGVEEMSEGRADEASEGWGDLGPRPSDSPDADTWEDTDPSILEEDDPCCELVGDPVQIDDGFGSGGPPAVAWNGDGWGVVWGAFFTGITFRPLDPMAVPLGPPVFFPMEFQTIFPAIDWNPDHYGVVGFPYVHTSGEGPGFVALLDEAGGILAHGEIPGESVCEPDIAWYETQNGWMVAYADETLVNVIMVDLAGNVQGDPYGLGSALEDTGPRIVGLKSLVSVVWTMEDGIYQRSFRWPPGDPPPDELLVLPIPGHGDLYVEATDFRDDVVVIGMDGTSVLAVVVDPWSIAVEAGPIAIGASTIRDRRPGIAAVNERGFLGVCYETGRGSYGGGVPGYDGVAFQLIGPDGRPWGQSVAVAENLANIGGCAAAWSGSEFIVIYKYGEGDDPASSIMAQRVRPLI